MLHTMFLNEKPFDQIKNKSKTFELRLYDEKRRALNIGDLIEFTSRSDDPQIILCKIIALHVFDSFKALYAALPLNKCGYAEDEQLTASPND